LRFGLVQGQVLVLSSGLSYGLSYGLGYGLGFGPIYGLGNGLGFGLIYGQVQGLNYDWLGFIAACISQVFKGSIASLKCSCFLGDKTSQVTRFLSSSDRSISES